MLKLEDDLYIGSGKHQSVYEHPQESSLCVKILIDSDPIFFKEEQRNRYRESNYINRTFKKSPDCNCIVRFYGLVETDKGEGALYSLVRDEDGNISKSLEDYLAILGENSTNAIQQIEELGVALECLYNSLLKYKIITRNIRPVNVCVQRSIDNKIKNLVIIDDLGPTEFIPITENISFLAVSKIKRKYKRFLQLLRGYSSSKEYQSMLEKLLAKIM